MKRAAGSSTTPCARQKPPTTARRNRSPRTSRKAPTLNPLRQRKPQSRHQRYKQRAPHEIYETAREVREQERRQPTLVRCRREPTHRTQAHTTGRYTFPRSSIRRGKGNRARRRMLFLAIEAHTKPLLPKAEPQSSETLSRARFCSSGGRTAEPHRKIKCRAAGPYEQSQRLVRHTQRWTASAVSLGFVLKHSLAWGACSCTTLINLSNRMKLLGIVRMPAPMRMQSNRFCLSWF